MIHLTDISLSFGGQKVLDRLSWHIKPDLRIGLIGPNGAGKSTLLRLVAGIHTPDEGTVSMASTTTVGYLQQDVQELDTSLTVYEEAVRAFEDVLRLEREELAITHEMDAHDDHESEAYHRLLHRLERVQTQLNTRDAHRIQDTTESVLSGLGFEADEMHRPLETFSGGWRMRATLARMLLRRPDVLLLDEPTNHLDIDSIDWLEAYLKDYRGTVVLVSHDRYFLDRMVNTIAELQYGRVTEYAGAYSYYLREREARRELQQAAYDNQQREIEQIERFIERFRYKASKARQVQSRVKQLEKMERLLPPPQENAAIHFRFPAPERSGRVVMQISDFSKQYPRPDGEPTVVFDDAGPLKIERGDKIALIGKNGAGKSTLARILLGTEPFEGTREIGYRVEMTYFAQHQADSLDPGQNVLETLQAHAAGQSQTQIRSLLGAFLFSGDDVFKPVGVLSGGERSRVALARTLLAPANLLILDEPTNHLDMQSIAVLVEALRQYSGTFVVVSHDRHFLDQIVNRIWRVGDGEVQSYPGTYSEYHWYMEQQEADAPEEAKSAAAATDTGTSEEASDGSGGRRKTKEEKRREAEERNRRYRERKQAGRKAGKGTHLDALSTFKLQKLLKDVEAEIAAKETRKAEVEAELADPEYYKDPQLSTRTLAEFNSLESALEALYERWEAIATRVEASVDT